MKLFLRFLLLVVLLNVIRYFVAGPVEMFLILGPLFQVMEDNPGIFNTEFTTTDWVTSYSYNFMMWLVISWVYLLLHPHLKGHVVVRSLKVYGIMFLFFASLSAVYMNHYADIRMFYVYNTLDALVVFPIVAVANGLLFPRLIPEKLLPREERG